MVSQPAKRLASVTLDQFLYVFIIWTTRRWNKIHPAEWHRVCQPYLLECLYVAEGYRNVLSIPDFSCLLFMHWKLWRLIDTFSNRYVCFFRLIFPNGFSSEYSLVTIFRVRRTTKKDRWYLWQIFDQSGDTQVGPSVRSDVICQFSHMLEKVKLDMFFVCALLLRYLLWLMEARRWWSSPPRACWRTCSATHLRAVTYMRSLIASGTNWAFLHRATWSLFMWTAS